MFYLFIFRSSGVLIISQSEKNNSRRFTLLLYYTYIWNSEIYSIISRVKFLVFQKKEQPNPPSKIHVFSSRLIPLHVGQKLQSLTVWTDFYTNTSALITFWTFWNLSQVLASSLPFEWLPRIHPTEERSRDAEREERRGCCCAAAAQKHLDLPLSKRAWGREDAAGPQGITAPIDTPCHTHISHRET